jgi:hypothetical protein
VRVGPQHRSSGRQPMQYYAGIDISLERSSVRAIRRALPQDWTTAAPRAATHSRSLVRFSRLALYVAPPCDPRHMQFRSDLSSVGKAQREGVQAARRTVADASRNYAIPAVSSALRTEIGRSAAYEFFSGADHSRPRIQCDVGHRARSCTTRSTPYCKLSTSFGSPK